MSQNDINEDRLRQDPEDQDGGVFRTGLRKARSLIRDDNDPDAALDLLRRLEVDYVLGAEIFDLIAEVQRRKGNVLSGVRYQTLYDVLRGNFNIVEEDLAEAGVALLPGPRRHEAETLLSEAFQQILQPPRMPEVDAGQVSEDEFVPITAAMGHEFMRQGHHERALVIYDRLLQSNPDDENLKQAKDAARKKVREKRALEIFQGWLKKINRMKSEPLTGV